MCKFEYINPGIKGPVILTREQALVELLELKPYTSRIQILDEKEAMENRGAVLVAAYPDDQIFDGWDEWYTFSSKVFDNYEAAETFVKEAGCESLLEE